MNLLKRIPVHYKGELHDVRLINFTVEMDELRDRVPEEITIRDFGGRAMISMVDVKLQGMHPVVMPLMKFNYRHVAFRLLVADEQYNNGVNKGIFFYCSFTDKPLMVAGGRVLTDYNLETGRINEHNGVTEITQGQQYVKYRLGELNVSPQQELKATIGALDRAYSVMDGRLRVTQIQREKWPIQLVGCTEFETTFFKSARLEGVFRVFETIYYDWLPPHFLRA